MSSLRERYDNYLKKWQDAERCDTDERFHCWKTFDYIDKSIYDWMGKFVKLDTHKRDLFIWLGRNGAIYVTTTQWIHPKRPKSTVSSRITIDMICYCSNKI